MRVQIVLAALLFVGYVSQSDAWLFRNTWVAKKAKQVTIWVKKNCSVGFPLAVSCKLSGRKRALANETNSSQDDACAAVGENPVATDEGFSYNLVKSIFENADGGGNQDAANGVLSVEEYQVFLESLREHFVFCFVCNLRPWSRKMKLKTICPPRINKTAGLSASH